MKDGICVVTIMGGDLSVIKCLSKPTTLNCIQPKKCIFIIIKNKWGIKSMLKNKELYILYLL